MHEANADHTKLRGEQAPPTWLVPFVNAVISAILRSPAHRLVSRHVMLIRFTGRVSGRRYATPVSRIQSGPQFQIFTRTRWWKNLRSGAPVTLVVEGRSLRGQAVADDTITAVVDAAQAFLHAHGVAAARRLGLSLPPDHMPSNGELHTALHGYALVTVTVDDERAARAHR